MNQSVSQSNYEQTERKRRGNGVYIQGSIEGIPLIFTTDTGATKTIILEQTYNKIPMAKRPKLSASPSCTVQEEHD